MLYKVETNTKRSGKTEQEKYGLKNKQILVVEDNEINREIVCAFLMHFGAKLDVAENGEGAVELFGESKENFYDTILMDIRMPVMDGREAKGIIRKMQRTDAQSVPIIAMSADVFTDDIKYSQRIGMNAYVTKPIDVDVLYKTIMRCTKK